MSLNLEKIAAENRSLPLNADGHIVSPRYSPVGSPYLSVWRLWLKSHPKSEWPAWLVADVGMMRKKK